MQINPTSNIVKLLTDIENAVQKKEVFNVVLWITNTENQMSFFYSQQDTTN